MHVTLVRHGAAGSAARDEVRPLTAAGEDEARALATALARRGLRFDRIVASPLLRARQTAQLLLDATRGAQPASPACAVQVEQDERLVPDGSPSAAVELLGELEAAGAREVALVAHMPIVAGIAELLLARRVPGFRTGQALRLPYPGAAPLAAARAPLDWLPGPVPGQD